MMKIMCALNSEGAITKVKLGRTFPSVDTPKRLSVVCFSTGRSDAGSEWCRVPFCYLQPRK
jgi:hypothetical protein